jgi:lysosomal acid lipase/cholesteryl ester hydrolase
MIERHGYTSETHTVTTEDGYILNLHRIPNRGKPPVLLNHGILMSSVDYVITGPDRALGKYLIKLFILNLCFRYEDKITHKFFKG